MGMFHFSQVISINLENEPTVKRLIGKEKNTNQVS